MKALASSLWVKPLEKLGLVCQCNAVTVNEFAELRVAAVAVDGFTRRLVYYFDKTSAQLNSITDLPYGLTLLEPGGLEGGVESEYSVTAADTGKAAVHFGVARLTRARAMDALSLHVNFHGVSRLHEPLLMQPVWAIVLELPRDLVTRVKSLTRTIHVRKNISPAEGLKVWLEEVVVTPVETHIISDLHEKMDAWSIRSGIPMADAFLMTNDGSLVRLQYTSERDPVSGLQVATAFTSLGGTGDDILSMVVVKDVGYGRTSC